MLADATHSTLRPARIPHHRLTASGLATGFRRVFALAPIPVAATPVIAIALQVAALVLVGGEFRSISGTISQLVAILGQEERPPLSEVMPAALALARSLVIVMGCSAAAWMVAAIAASVWVRATLRRRVTLERLPASHRFVVAGLTVASTLVVAVLTVAVSAPFQQAAVTEARGTTITAVIPGPSLIVAALVAIAASLVFMAAILPLALAINPPDDTKQDDVIPPAPSAHRTARLPRALPIAVVSLTAVFAVIALISRPVSDDYRVMAAARDLGLAEYLELHLRTETGRFSQGTANWLLVRVFGDAVNAGTAITIFLLVAVACGLAVRVFLPGVRDSAPGAHWWLGGAFAVVSVLLVPSIVDSWLWFTAADVYMPGVAFAAASAALIKMAWADQISPPWRPMVSVAAVVVTFIAQGFSEAASALIWLGATVLLIVSLRQKGARRRALAIAVWLSATAGLALIALTPGQSARSERVDSGSLVVGVLGGTYSGLPLWNQIGLEGWLLIGGVAMVFATVLSPWATERQLVTMGTVGAALFIVVPPIGGLIAFLGLNWVPWRTLTVPGVAFGWGVVLFLAALFVPLIRAASSRRAARAVNSVSTITLTLAVVVALPTLIGQVEAGAMRMNMITARDASVAQELKQGVNDITIHPAPPLVYPTDSRDFEFLEVQNKDWFYPGYRDWFDIPSDATLVYDTAQPLGYCVEDPRVLLPGVLTCVELGINSASEPFMFGGSS